MPWLQTVGSVHADPSDKAAAALLQPAAISQSLCKSCSAQAGELDLPHSAYGQDPIICGVADFMERMELKYDAKAKAAGCCVVSGAGFDSVPADVGTLWTQRKFGPKGLPATVESYVTMHCKRRLRGALEVHK